MPKAAVPFIVVALAMVGEAGALGFGSVQTSTMLGQPLNLAVPLRLEDGETLTPECVSAEVLAGDHRLSSDVVRVVIDRAAPDARERLMRIVTSVAIDEPVVTITLAAGCPTRLTRRIVAFADPPGLQTPTPTPMPAPAALAQGIAAPAANDTASAARSAAVATATQPPRSAASAPTRRPRRAVASSNAAASTAASSAASPRSTRTRTAVAPTPAKAAAPQARLRLAPEEPGPNAAAVAAAEATASAAQAAAIAAQAAASAADLRLKALETEVARMRGESQANRDTMLQMRSRLAEAESSGRMTPVLLALLALAIAAIGGLAWRLRKLSKQRPPWWDGPEAAAAREELETPVAAPLPSQPARFVPSTTAAIAEPTMPGAMGRPAAASSPVPMPSAAPTTSAMPSYSAALPSIVASAATLSMAPSSVESVRESRREVTIEEQIDLEQQADFFIVLGQDDAAIDLLLNHLRGTGGTSPMPYLKLLEIHRRRGEREAYERARTRFNQRFNGVAPEWDMDPQSGRSLEDYPEVVARLQEVWWSPLDAMAELEALMFRRGEGAELFDLPAYQEVLSLYQLARDLLHHEASASPGEVDVLLPLADTNHGGLSVRHLDMESTRVLRPRVDVELPEPMDLELDLDLSSQPMPYRPDVVETADVSPDGRDSHIIDFDLDAPPPGTARH